MGFQPAKAGPTFDVKNFGAVGDGVHDDSASIQRAFDAGAANLDATIFFPAGRYFHTQLLKARNISLVGASKSSAIIDGAAVQLLDRTGAVSNLTFTSRPNFIRSALLDISALKTKVDNTAFRSIDLRTVPALQVYRTASCNIDRCDFIGARTQILCDSCDSTSVTNSVFTDSSAFGTAIDISNSTNAVIESNQFALFQNAIRVRLTNTARINQNTLDNCALGIFVGNSQNIQVTNNTLRRNTKIGIESHVSDVAINSNFVQMAGQFASFGIKFHFSGARVNSNRIEDAGVGIQGDLGGLRGSLISGNTIERTIADGVRVLRILDGDSCTIDSNSLRDCGLIARSDVISVARGFLNNQFAPVITNNRYSGGTNRLQYFIRCLQPSPPAIVSGNVTTTMLPSFIAQP